MKRSKFSLSKTNLTSFNQGQLIPCGLTEVLPGDTIQQSTSALIRVSPLLAPVMHPVDVRIHHWFVPHRLVWDAWEDFITGGPDGMDASAFPVRDLSVTGPASYSLADYYGIPTQTMAAAGSKVSALPFRGYGLIFNEWYRDQDLTSELVVDTGDGDDTTTNMNLQKVAWEKDYFTTARPWTQKGPEVTVPLTSAAQTAAVTRKTNAPAWGVYNAGTNTAATTGNVTVSVGGGLNGVGSGAISLDPGANGLETAFTPNVDGGTINELRTAFALQRYEEARARYGSRYTEYLRYLGIKSSDARLQRPEYLGGGKQRIQFSEVLQTGVTTDGDDTEGVGEMKGHGIGAMRSNRYRRFFEEHGYIHSFISVKPKTIYMNGVERTWNRRTKEDFFQKELQFIGQQEILKKEVWASSADPNGVWGYQDRYDEYRQGMSYVSGEFRGSLNFWHMARLFSAEPALNSTFVTANPTDRVYATASAANELLAMINHSIQARRIVAAGATPGVF